MFKEELDLIARDDIRSFTEAVITAAPQYAFVDCPSSSSRKYHNSDELGGDGTIVHTKRVVGAALSIGRMHGCDQFMDHIVSACILHDLAKQGLEKSGHTVKDHAQVMAEFLLNFYGALPEKDFDIIRNCVYYHYGQWTVKRANKPLDKFTDPEWVCHLADYIASRKQF